MAAGVAEQERLIARVRELCHADDRLTAALMYGSFAHGEADEHSDIEFWLFFATPPDPVRWLSRIGPLRHVLVNESGTHVVFFPGLIRGEFHLVTAAEIGSVATWPARGGPVADMVVLDRTGELRQALESLPAHPPLPDAAELCGRFVNWLVLAHHVLQRGELLRAADALAHARRHLLWMTRLAEGSTQHWLTPSRAAESDLPAGVVAALHAVDAGTRSESLRAAWRLGRACWTRLGVPVPEGLFVELDDTFGG
ncbi:nucleotidyltransferase domain-containing protein [Catenuloplanes japonicus]|uniref:nucleotidyltransferase domain-containing protein n=1 Tax=Catenuloplanes japonicus TaxID=33876 RepID=UPI000AE7728E|nr:nucleotidyltransferase domain-containing protein [Catenuloplanes japonicus]